MSGGSSAVFTIAGLLSNMSLRHLSPSLRTAVNNADTCTHSTYQCYGALSLTLRKPTQPAAPSVVACHLMPHVTVLPTFYTYVCTSLQDSLRAYVGTCWRPSHSPLLLGKEINADGCQSLLQAAADIATSTAHEPNSIIAVRYPMRWQAPVWVSPRIQKHLRAVLTVSHASAGQRGVGVLIYNSWVSQS